MVVREFVLWGFMAFAGIAFHFGKALIQAKRTNGGGCTGYWRKHPVESVLSVVGTFVLFVIMWRAGYMNDAMAFSVGYMGNSAADIVGGRAAAAGKKL